MKIAVVGPHSCGKTTLTYELAAYLKRQDKSVCVITEQIRKCPFEIGTEECSKWILFSSLKEELEAEKGHEVIVCDRSSGDILAYARASGILLPRYIISLAIEHLETYDKIICLAPSRPIVDDGFRDLDEEYRSKVKDEFDIIFGEGVEYHKDNLKEFLKCKKPLQQS